jgi:hypothetical protein
VTQRYVTGSPDERFDAYLTEGPLLPGMATPCIIWTGYTNPKGYGQFGIRSGRSVVAHRYALARALGPDPRQVHHDCDNPPCCNPEHLRYGTNDENMAAMVQRGRSARGERKPQARLTEQLVTQIRERVRAGEAVHDIARETGIAPAAIYTAVRGRSWAHLPGAIPNITRLRYETNLRNLEEDAT